MAKIDPRVIGAAILAGVAVASPIAEKWEGYRGKAYLDPAKILTQCYGETKDIDPAKIYSQTECAAKLRARMAKDYAPIILQCVPGFIQAAHDPKVAKVFGAFIDASYNAGPERVCIRFAPPLNAGKTETACNSLRGWFTTAKNRKTGIRKEYPGLIARRLDERAVCLKGAARE